MATPTACFAPIILAYFCFISIVQKHYKINCLIDLHLVLSEQRLLAAEQGNKKIAVEIKSFVSPSEMEDLKYAIGGFVTYRAVIQRIEPERTLYLAVRDNVFTALFEEPIGKLLIESENLYLIVFNPDSETIVQWIP
ncbi:hypothetical protein NUACC21_27810 [Scytonema sp. NUACC21]